MSLVVKHNVCMNNLDKWLSSHLGGQGKKRRNDYQFGIFKKNQNPQSKPTSSSPAAPALNPPRPQTKPFTHPSRSARPDLPARPSRPGLPARPALSARPSRPGLPARPAQARYPLDANHRRSGMEGGERSRSGRPNFDARHRRATWERRGFYQPPTEIRQSLLPDFVPYKVPTIRFTPGTSVRIVPIGGLEEVGKNMTLIETKHDMIIVDCGLQFPEEDMFGVDYAIPDISYVVEHKHKLRGILITHGHFDHIGALRHLLPAMGNPLIAGSRLSIALIKKQLEEYGQLKDAKLAEYKDHERMRLGEMIVETFHINHSIPDGRGLIIRTPAGIIVHSGDFKFDKTPPPTDKPTDFEKIKAIGREGVLALLADSTNATVPGYTKSEQEIGETLDDIVRQAPGRLIVASFASVIGRLQQLINSALKYGRTIFVSGRSMEENLAISKQLGYVKYPEKAVERVSNKINDLAPEKVLLLSTGSQGEEFSALTRMSTGNHQQVKIQKGDTVVLSSSPIPGNERSIANIQNNLLKRGAYVITDDAMAVHTSGHAKQEEIKLLISLIRPKYYLPIHGEYYMRHRNKELALEVGLPENHVPMLTNGSIVEFQDGRLNILKDKLTIHEIIVDGKGHGMESGRVQEERKIMSKDGVIILVYKVQQKDRSLLGAPKFISKGFVYEEELGELNKKIVKEAKDIYDRLVQDNPTGKQKELVQYLRNDLNRYIERTIDRRPIVIPVLVES